MTIVTGAVSTAYLPLVDLWLDQSARHMPGPPLLVAMDDQAYTQLSNDSRVEAVMASSKASFVGDRQSFWGRRLAEIARVAQDAPETIQSDADAFWLSSPMALFKAIDADLIFTQDHGVPKNVTAAWGFTLCCGFYVLRRSKAVMAMMAQWQVRADAVRDDQIAFNQMIFECQPVWRDEQVSDLTLKIADIQLLGHNLRIAVLPYDQFSRRPPYAAAQAIIAHPFFERRFFVSYLGLYRDLLDEHSCLNAWQAKPHIEGFDQAAPVRDVATYQLLCRQLGSGHERPGYRAHRAGLLLRFGAHTDALADLDLARLDHDQTLATMLGLIEIHLQAGQATQCRQLIADTLTHPDLELPIVRELMALALRHRQPGMLLGIANQAVTRFGATRMLRYGQSWIAKKRSKAL